MRRSACSLVPLALATIALAACTGGQPQPRNAPEPERAPSAVATAHGEARAAALPANVAQGQAEFAASLYRRLAREPGNLFFSPASISAALGMVYAGAQDETALEMAQALRYPAQGTHEQLGALLRRLPIDAEGRRLTIGNALWVERDFALKPDFVATVRRHFDGSAQPVDFRNAPAEAIAAINRWAETQTGGRIREVIRPEDVNDRTRLILTNAVWFKGDWLHPFPANSTRPRPFFTEAQSSFEVPFMRQRGRFRLLDQPHFEAVELPYKGEELSMMLFVPKARDGLARLEGQLDALRLSGWIDALRASQAGDIELVVPKLELGTRASLVEPLQALGMRRAFTDQAQLTGIADARLRVSDVIHQTYLRVDETGTEAAAVTAPIIEIVSMPRTVQADRPFLLLIRDNRSGTILFMGRIARP